jgi:hypothetical protein
MREDRPTACRIIICDFRFRPAVGPCRRRLPARGSLPCARSLCGFLEPQIRWSMINLVGACAGHARPSPDASQAPTASPCYRRRFTKHLIATATRFRGVAPQRGQWGKESHSRAKAEWPTRVGPGALSDQPSTAAMLCRPSSARREARRLRAASGFARALSPHEGESSAYGQFCCRRISLDHCAKTFQVRLR